MVRSTLRTVLTAIVVGSVLFAGTATAAEDITGGGSGDAGDLGGAPPLDPGTVTAGTSTANHVLTFTVENVSMDGNTDRINVSVPNAVAEAGLGINGASVENATSGAGVSISSSSSLVNGADGDELRDTVTLAVSPDGSGAVTLNVRLDLSTTAPAVETEQQYDFVATVRDSDGSIAGPTEVATLTVVPENQTSGDQSTDDASGDGTTDDDTGDRTTDSTDDGSTDTSDDSGTDDAGGDDQTTGASADQTTDADGAQSTDDGESEQSTSTTDGAASTTMDGGDDADGESNQGGAGDATTTEGTGAGFGVAAALAALIGTILTVRRRA